MSEPLTTARWRDLAALIDELLDTPAEARGALIAVRSGGDAARRAELELLLAGLEKDVPLLDRPATERFAALFSEPPVPFPASLADRYRLIRELGKGGMATVFLARDLKHNRDVAVKVMRPELVLGRERFHREIAIVARLRHPHIVPLFDSGEADGALYYVMPYEEGESLRARLRRHGPLEVRAAATVLHGIAEALACAHGHGIVHRDIKPDNVLLSGDHALVTDFGVARAVTESAEGAALITSGIALGTPAYMAPEQITTDTHADHRSDIYAFGVLAYEVLSGRPPFHGKSPHHVVLAHLTESPVPLRERRPDVPVALETLVMRCLRKAPPERLQSATDLLDALNRADAPSTGEITAAESPAPTAVARAEGSAGGRGGIGLLFAWPRVGIGLVASAVIVSAGIVASRTRQRGAAPVLSIASAGDSTPARRPTRNVAAYELYVRGSDPALLRSDSGAWYGVDLFRQAIAIDSSYAAAWAGLGRMYARVAADTTSPNRERLLRLADSAASKAVTLDDSLAEAQASLGLLRMTSFDFTSAEEHLQRAVELEPTRAVYHEYMVSLYLWIGRPGDALAHAQRALDLDPLSPSANAELAHALLGNDRCDEALAQLERLSELDPPLLRVPAIAGACYARKRMWPEAIAVLRPQAESDGWSALGELGFVFGRSGQRSEALRIRATLLDRWRHGGGAFELALVHAGLGEVDEAIAWLDRAITDGSLAGAPANPSRTLIVGPLFEDVRRHPGFARLRERMGLPRG